MSAPRNVTHLTSDQLTAMATITEEDKALAQISAPKAMKPFLNAGSAE